MEYKSSEIRAGLFIFVSMIVFVAMVFFLGNFQDSFKSRSSLRIMFNYTGGLNVGAPVRYAGLEVGKVTDIVLVAGHGKTGRDRVEVVASVNPSITLKKNSQASIKTSGLMGGLYIGIRPGTLKSPKLQPGEVLVGQDTFELAQMGEIMNNFLAQVQRFTDLSDQLISDSRETLAQVKGSLNNVDAFLVDNQKHFHRVLVNAEKITGELRFFMDREKGDFAKTLHNVASVTEKADKIISDKEPEISAIIEQASAATRELELLMADNRPGITNLVRTTDANAQKIAVKINSMTANLDSTFQQTNAILVENRRQVMEMLRNMREATEALKAFAGDVERNPWKLVRKGEDRPSKDDGWEIQPDENALRMKRMDKLSAK